MTKIRFYPPAVLAMAASVCLVPAEGLQAQDLVRYVDIDKSCSASCNGTGTCGDGLSWSTAFKFLQDALVEANDVETGTEIIEIWVADGTYYPDESAACPTGTGNRSATFEFGRGQLRIMGGFDSTETDKNQRNPFTNLTILSGDIDEDNTLDNDNSYHVVSAIGAFPTAVLDGFTITMGYAVDAPTPTPTTEHVPEHAGGGLISYSVSANPPNFPPSDPTILRCTFHTNIAELGGAMLISASEQGGPNIHNCVFRDNEAEEGGAIYVDDFFPQSQPKIINTLFHDNEAKGIGGGALFCSLAANTLMVNCTLSQNSVPGTSTGGGVYHEATLPLSPPLPPPSSSCLHIH